MIINGDTSIMVPAMLYLKILGAVSSAEGFLCGIGHPDHVGELEEVRLAMLELLKEEKL